MPPDTDLIRALLTLAAILGLGGMFLGVLYGLVVFRTRQLARRARGLMAALAARDQVIAGLKADLLALGLRAEQELLTADAKRRATQQDCARAQEERDKAVAQLRHFTGRLEVLKETL